MDGFLNLLKPPGMTSSDAVLFVRKRLPRGTKTGHAGTLDPEAAGVLPIMVGKATRLFDYVTDKQKTYIAQWKPGVATDTQDAFGSVTERLPGCAVSRAALEAVLPSFTGTILQTPPAFSAIKRGGKRLYDLARSGEAVELEARPVRIDGLRVLEACADGSFLIEVRCGRGTYIRTLCKDIGAALNVPAHMGTLLRAAAGSFTLQDAHTLEEIDGAEDLTALLTPMDAVLTALPATYMNERALPLVRCGNPVPLQMADAIEADEDAPSRLYVGGRFCGIGRVRGGAIRFDAMLLTD